MPYVSHAELAERPGARELAQVATQEDRPVVTIDLMDATLRGLPRVEWETEAIADADAALRRIDDAVAEADAVIDGYLAKRGYRVPMDLSAASTRKLIAGWSRSIARYLLQKDQIGDEKTSSIARDYRDALRLLDLTAKGNFSLGAEDPQTPNSSATDVRFSYPEPVFGRKQLGAFR